MKTMKQIHPTMTTSIGSLHTTAAALTLLVLCGVSSPTAAFSSIHIPVPPPSSSGTADWTTTAASPPVEEEKTLAANRITNIESSPWRIVLDIGREPLANGMPFDWARSGCRMPLKVPAEFVTITTATTTTANNDDENIHNKENLLQPLSSTVSCTGPDGAIVRPIEGGNWKLSQSNIEKEDDDDDEKKSNNNKSSQISFELTFPDGIERRDVYIEAGATLECIGTCYTQSQFEQLNQEYYDAREAVWEIGTELNDAVGKQNAPKKWNEDTQKWEKAYPNENPLSWFNKRMRYMAAKAKQESKNKQRPDLNSLSDLGLLPGLQQQKKKKKNTADNINGLNSNSGKKKGSSTGEGIYIAKEGIIRSSTNGAVMGRWSAEPIKK